MSNKSEWLQTWTGNERFEAERQKKFEVLSKAFATPPARLLDIGAGLAIEAGMIQQRFGTHLYLLDGSRPVAPAATPARLTEFGSVDDMGFYLTEEELRSEWDRRGLTYDFLDARNLKIDPDLKFDVIYSGKSCGFHYPLSSYRDLLHAHSHDDSYLIFDLRKDADQGDIRFRVKDVLLDMEKAQTSLIELL